MTSTSEILNDPHWFPAALDAASRTMTFLRTDRAALSAAPFLDERFTQTQKNPVTLPLSDVFAHTPQASAPPHWIFHTAFCCSTLMARAMDVPGHSLSLKEPGILMGLANANRVAQQQGLSAKDLRQLTDAVFALLARRFSPSEAIIIKPTNPANPVAADALAQGHRAIFMVSELKDFLISVLKKGEACKAFMRTLYNIFALDPAPLGKIPQRQALTFTDLQITTLVQQHQMEFMTGLGQTFAAQTRAFDGNKLPANPQAFLEAAAHHFDLGWTSTTAEQQASSEVFSRNSKFDDEMYSGDARAEDAAEIEAIHSEALSVTLQWAATLTLGGRSNMPPATPLC